METILKCVDLFKSYFMNHNELRVLRGINLEIARGEIVAIIGASGAGKSTLLHILGTLDRPTSGKVYISGIDVFSLNDDKLAKFRSGEIGFVFQFHHLLPEFTALENVMMPALIAGKKMSEVKAKAEVLLSEVGLSERLNHRPAELSGGEQQRVAVARAMMNDPGIILADEPSGNLDTENASALHSLLVDLNRSHGTTFVIATHNEDLKRLAGRVMKIQDGTINIHAK
ncbi:MAG: ABC transporter ATP-binding protein [Candidatus Kryptoniota bacterium]